MVSAPTLGTFSNLPDNAIVSAGANTLRINYAAGDGNDVTLTVVPARVASVVVNNGEAQRSQVTNLTVTFTEPVTFPMDPADAFELKRQGNDAVVDLNVVSTTANSVSFSFAGPTTILGSLVDGRYSLTIDATLIGTGHGSLDGDSDNLAGGSYSLVGTPVNGLYRLFGDGNGDGKVDSNDFILFRAGFNTAPPNPLFNSAFDSNGDNKIDSSDFIAFRARFNTSV